MTPITCIIVDDEPLAVKLLESFVAKTPQLQLLASFTDSVEALSFLRDHPVQLAFMDIQMPDMNGMELSHMLPERTKVIFTTAFKEYAFESYEVSALDFLLKPIRYNKFLAAVEKAKGFFSRNVEGEMWNENCSAMDNSQQGNLIPHSTFHIPQTIFLKVDGEYRQVALERIIYVCGMKDYVMFYLEGERKALITHLTMKAVEDMLPQQLFMRVNRSYIVALDKIRKVDRNDCIYIGEEGTSAEIIRVTEAYRETFQQYLQSKFPGA